MSELLVLQREIERLAERLERVEQARPVGGAEWSPNVDVFRCRGALTIIAEVPELGVESLSVSCTSEHVVIAGQRPMPRPAAGAAFVCMERPHGRFVRTIPIDSPVDRARAEARLDAGLLTISLPLLNDRRGGEHAIPIVRTGES